MMINLPILYCAGVLLGNPQSVIPSEKVLIESIDPQAIIHAENISTTPGKLAVNLLQALFTHEEISTGNCTKPVRPDIIMLDPKKIQGIRGKTFIIFTRKIYTMANF